MVATNLDGLAIQVFDVHKFLGYLVSSMCAQMWGLWPGSAYLVICHYSDPLRWRSARGLSGCQTLYWIPLA